MKLNLPKEWYEKSAKLKGNWPIGTISPELYDFLQKDGFYLFLDDIRFPKDVTWVELPSSNNDFWVIVRNYEEFCAIIKEHFRVAQHLPAFIAIDHDLGPNSFKNCINGKPADYNTTEKNGLHCVKWLVEFCINNDLDFPEYAIISQNPIGRENIISYIESYKKSRNKLNEN